MERKIDVLWERLTITPLSFLTMAKTLNVKNPCHEPKFFMSTFILFISARWLTNQILVSYGEITISDNLTQALLFLSHFMGDVHQVCLTITITKL